MLSFSSLDLDMPRIIRVNFNFLVESRVICNSIIDFPSFGLFEFVQIGYYFHMFLRLIASSAVACLIRAPDLDFFVSWNFPYSQLFAEQILRGVGIYITIIEGGWIAAKLATTVAWRFSNGNGRSHGANDLVYIVVCSLIRIPLVFYYYIVSDVLCVYRCWISRETVIVEPRLE